MNASSDPAPAPPPSVPPAAPEGPKRGPRAFLGIYLRGAAMGAADIVPGVSGGTMALILGIYEEFIESLRSLARRPFLAALLSGRLRAAFGHVHGGFLLVLAAGIFTSVLALSRLLEWLLEHHLVLVYSFFFGLILASVLLVGRRIRRWSVARGAWLALGAIVAYGLVGLTPAVTPTTPVFLFLSGALAVCALLLPGISGAFILVLLGKYETILGALNRGELWTLALTALGGVVGLLSFSQLLGWLFRRHHDASMALLTGFMLGSLRKVWPWQDHVGELTRNRFPPALLNAPAEAGLLAALALAALGVGLVLLLERPASRS